MRFCRAIIVVVVGVAITGVVSACGEVAASGGADANQIDAAQQGIVASGTVIGPMAAAGPVMVLWAVDRMNDDHLYKFGQGTATATAFTATVPDDPPAAAHNQGPSVDVGVALLALMAPGTAFPDGRLSTDPAFVGLSRRYAIIYRGPTDTGSVVAWTTRFPVGLSCGRCVDSASGFDTFEPIDCKMLVIDTDPTAPSCNFT
jgi:hypothetical protein